MSRNRKPVIDPPEALGTHVALLRGLNVGGKNKLSMKDLIAMFVAAGCADVRNYIQSGNIVFRANAALAGRIPQLVTAEIAERFHYRAPMVLRTADELLRVLRDNPFVQPGEDVGALHIMFLAGLPSSARVAMLDPRRSPPDSFVARGREIYLHCPNGVARTRLTNDYFDSTLGTLSTGRNWKTVLKLVEMTRE